MITLLWAVLDLLGSLPWELSSIIMNKLSKLSPIAQSIKMDLMLFKYRAIISQSRLLFNMQEFNLTMGSKWN